MICGAIELVAGKYGHEDSYGVRLGIEAEDIYDHLGLDMGLIGGLRLKKIHISTRIYYDAASTDA